MSRTMAGSVPPALGFGVPLALLTFTQFRSGPNALSSGACGLRRHRCTKPMNETLGVARVLPIGVPQQLVYQRSSPLEVSRMQASFSAPCKNVTALGSV